MHYNLGVAQNFRERMSIERLGQLLSHSRVFDPVELPHGHRLSSVKSQGYLYETVLVPERSS